MDSVIDTTLQLEAGISTLITADTLLEVFRRINDENHIKTLLTCRLVCHSWKSVIDNSAEILRRLTVHIRHPLLSFLDTSFGINTRSVCLKKLDQFKNVEVMEFLNRIKLTVQVIFIELDSNKIQDPTNAKILFQRILKCPALKELHITTVWTFVEVLLTFPKEKLVLIQSLNLKIQHFSPEETEIKTNEEAAVKMIEQLILELPYLKSLKFSDSSGPEKCDIVDKDVAITILDIVENHMTKFPKVLKEFYTPKSNGFGHNRIGQERWLKLLVHCGKQDVEVTSYNKQCLFLKCLLTFTSSPNSTEEGNEVTFPMDTIGIHYSQIKKGRIWLENLGEDQRLPNLERISYCYNLQSLNLVINKLQVSEDELNFVRCLTRLTYLRISGPTVYSMNARTLAIPIQLFSEYPALTRLEIHGDIFETGTIYRYFGRWFPRLMYLRLSEMVKIDPHFIKHLTKCRNLQELAIFSMKMLTDVEMLFPCQQGNRNGALEQEEDGDRHLFPVPAIAAFSCLKVLKLFDCIQLSGRTLIEGVARNRTLEKLSYNNLKSFDGHAKELFKRRSQLINCTTGDHFVEDFRDQFYYEGSCRYRSYTTFSKQCVHKI